MQHDILFSAVRQSTPQAEIDKVYIFNTISQEKLQPHILDDLLPEPRLNRLEDKTQQKARKALETRNSKSAY